MFGRLLRAVPNLRGASDLTSYVNNLHSMNGSAAPTRDEATRDYAAAIRATTALVVRATWDGPIDVFYAMSLELE